MASTVDAVTLHGGASVLVWVYYLTYVPFPSPCPLLLVGPPKKGSKGRWFSGVDSINTTSFFRFVLQGPVVHDAVQCGKVAFGLVLAALGQFRLMPIMYKSIITRCALLLASNRFREEVLRGPISEAIPTTRPLPPPCTVASQSGVV